MAEQHNLENETLAGHLNEKTSNEIEETKSTEKASGRRINANEKARHKAEKTLVEDCEALSGAHDKVEVERQARAKADRALGKMQNATSLAQPKIEQERRTKKKAEQDEVTRALEEDIRMKTVVVEENTEIPFKGYRTSNRGVERRISFIVRLTISEHNEPKRIEIEDVQTRKKESFHSLNGEQLAAFMRSSLSGETVAKYPPSQEIQSVKVEDLTPEYQKLEHTLAISDVQIFPMEASHSMSLVLSPEQDFVIQICFQLHDTETCFLPEQDSAYEIRIYANKVGSTDSRLLATYCSNFPKDAIEYTVPVEVPGLLPGVFRLVTLVTQGKLAKVVSYYEGPIVQFT